MKTLLFILLAAAEYSGRSATGHVDFSANIQQVGRLTMERVDDVVIVDALAFGETYHRAHYAPGPLFFDTGNGAGDVMVALE